ncbi:MAG: sodium:proton antiporter [Pseudomonadales bacterium]|nr:sodium:proton antiporter [Pseudomonadales bacterium]
MDILIVFMAMLFIAIIIEPLAEKINIPITAVLVVVGFLGSEALVYIGVDTGLRWYSFNDLVLHVFVPVLVFESAYNMHEKVLLKNLGSVLFLAIPAMVISAIITGLLLYFVIDYPSAFPFIAALLTGVIVSATDPVAVVALFNKLGAPERLTVLLEGESLFNDATAVVLFTLIVSLMLDSDANFDAFDSLWTFIKTFLGGGLVGAGFGMIGVGINRKVSLPSNFPIVSIIVATTTFYVAESLLHLSGIVALLCAGLILGANGLSDAPSKNRTTGELWKVGANICNALIFILVGVTINIDMFTSHWLAMLFGIGAAIVARFFTIYMSLPLVMKMFKIERLPESYKPVLLWGGLRGAVSLALALSLPVDIESWYTIQSIVYGVVLFTLFFQAPKISVFIKKVNEN